MSFCRTSQWNNHHCQEIQGLKLQFKGLNCRQKLNIFNMTKLRAWTSLSRPWPRIIETQWKAIWFGCVNIFFNFCYFILTKKGEGLIFSNFISKPLTDLFFFWLGKYFEKQSLKSSNCFFTYYACHCLTDLFPTWEILIFKILILLNYH